MIFDSHLLMSQIIYKYISNHTNFRLHRIAFAYGNVKPDFKGEDVRCEHTLDESLYCVNKYSAELMNRDITNKEFSKSLGVICHFVCDYFCIYHREGNEKKGMLEHLIYEFTLHLKLLTLFFSGKIKFNEYDRFGGSVETIALKLQEKYNSEKKCQTRDIIYALLAASQVSKLIVCSSQLYFVQKNTNISQEYRLS